MKALNCFLETARTQIGYLEKRTNEKLDDFTANAGYNNWTKYARDLDEIGAYNYPKNGLAWCDMFVDWCFIKSVGFNNAWKITNQEKKGCGAGCTESAKYYARMGRFDKKPRVGDQIFFTNDNGKTMYHTGLVEKVDKERVYTIEGNTSSSAGVVPNGGGVFRKSYPINYSQIGGYGHPAWELLENEDFEVEVEEMTQEQFNSMMDNYLAELAKKPSDDWSEKARDWAENKEYIRGDSNGNKMYKKFMTREEVIAVLYRILGKKF